MELNLTAKRAFVSGSTRGIGYAIAKALLAEGVAVTINGRSEAAVRQAVGTLKRDLPGATVSRSSPEVRPSL